MRTIAPPWNGYYGCAKNNNSEDRRFRIQLIPGVKPSSSRLRVGLIGIGLLGSGSAHRALNAGYAGAGYDSEKLRWGRLKKLGVRLGRRDTSTPSGTTGQGCRTGCGDLDKSAVILAYD
jgi:hypothetical protein